MLMAKVCACVIIVCFPVDASHSLLHVPVNLSCDLYFMQIYLYFSLATQLFVLLRACWFVWLFLIYHYLIHGVVYSLIPQSTVQVLYISISRVLYAFGFNTMTMYVTCAQYVLFGNACVWYFFRYVPQWPVYSQQQHCAPAGYW